MFKIHIHIRLFLICFVTSLPTAAYSDSGLSANGAQMFYQSSPGIQGSSESFDYFGSTVTMGDFNGDGYDDVASSAPTESIANNTIKGAGAVQVFYASANGVTTRDTLYAQDWSSINGTPHAYELFGFSLSSGDYNNDGYDDLAIGIPRDSDIVEAGGSIQILYGSPGGLTTYGNQLINQNTPGIQGGVELGDQFGFALASGDLDGDGFDDIVVGIPFETVNGYTNAGAIQIIYGSPTGLGARDKFISMSDPSISEPAANGDYFGFRLAVGDFDNDNYADVAVGIPHRTVSNQQSAGAVQVIYGSNAGLSNRNIHISLDSSGMVSTSFEKDHYGNALAAGDFNQDGVADLAVGIPYKDIYSIFELKKDAGAVHILYGRQNSGISALNNHLLTRGSNSRKVDQFGGSLAVGDFSNDGYDDLVVGAPQGDDYNSYSDSIYLAGVVVLFSGGNSGLQTTGETWSQNTLGVPGASETGDKFGSDVATGDINGDGISDLVVGVPNEAISTIPNAGAINILYGQ